MKQNEILPVVVHGHVNQVILQNICPQDKRGEIGAYCFYVNRF